MNARIRISIALILVCFASGCAGSGGDEQAGKDVVRAETSALSAGRSPAEISAAENNELTTSLVLPGTGGLGALSEDSTVDIKSGNPPATRNESAPNAQPAPISLSEESETTATTEAATTNQLDIEAANAAQAANTLDAESATTFLFN